MEDTPALDTEVRPGHRRTFTLAYKQEILAQFDACQEYGQKSALLRREGLYDAHISKWRQQMKRSLPTRRGRPALTEEQRLIQHLQEENAKLRAELVKTNLVVDVQKKLCNVLETLRKTHASDALKPKPSSSSSKPSR